MTAPEKTAIASHAATIILCIVVGVCAIVLTVAALKITDGGQQALATVNRGCAPGPCGTLAAIAKAVTKGGDAIVTTQMQEQTIGKHADAVLDSLGTIPQHANVTLDNLATTETAATETLHTASRSLQALSDGITPVLSHADSTMGDLDVGIKALQPTETALNRSIADFDAALKPISPIEANALKITTSGAVIVKDGEIEANRFTFPPKVPWWKKIVPDTLHAGELVWDFER